MDQEKDSMITVTPNADTPNAGIPPNEFPSNIAPTSFLCAYNYQPFPALPKDSRVLHLQPPNPLQNAITQNGVAFHVQYELERRVSSLWTGLSMEDFYPEDYIDLCGDIVQAVSNIDKVIKQVAKHKDSTSGKPPTYSPEVGGNLERVHIEAAKEEILIHTGKGHLEMDDYGGKIVYGAHITFDNVYGDFRVGLLQPELPGKSCQIMRFFGSRRVIVLRYNERMEQKFLFQLCVGRVFILFGRPYRALFRPIHSQTVYCVETDDNIPGITYPDPRDPPATAYLDLLDIFNSHELRVKDPMIKFAARFQLPFSSTRPATIFNREAIEVIPDILTNEATQEKYDGHQVLTDGCGFISRRCFKDNPRLSLLDGKSRTLQIRINGCKGLVALMSDDQEKQYQGKDIIIRRSMVKAYPAERYLEHPTNLTLNIVRYGVLRFGTYLFSDSLPALTHCGVPHSVLLDLYSASVEELKTMFSPLPLGGESPDDVLRRLYRNCNNRGGARSMREARERVAKGKGPCEDGGEFDRKGKGEDTSALVDELANGDIFGSARIRSFSAVESLMQCVMAGVDPTCSFTTRSLHDLAQDLLEAAFTKLKVFIPQSLYAFATPDHTGLLKPGEIQVPFSDDSRLRCQRKYGVSSVMGECLVFRSPCTLHNDIRKYRIVDHLELRHRTDEVIFCANSDLLTEGSMNHHSSGDYDGDAVFVIWDPQIVQPFTDDEDKSFKAPVGFRRDNFELANLRGKDFVGALEKANADEETRILNYQYFLLLSMSWDNPLGLYYSMHDHAVYDLGYKHPETVRLGHMFGIMLDSAKTGLAVRNRVKREDFAKYKKHVVEWKRLENEEYVASQDRAAGPFIMDELRELAKEKRKEISEHFPPHPRAITATVFETLSPIFSSIRSRTDISRQVEQQVDIVEAHVRRCLLLWTNIDACLVPPTTAISQLHPQPHTPLSRPWTDGVNPATGRPYTRNEIRKVQNIQKAYLAQIFQQYPEPQEISELWTAGDPVSLWKMKISCAVSLAKESQRELVVFDLDFQTVLQMMAESKGKYLMLTSEMYKGASLG